MAGSRPPLETFVNRETRTLRSEPGRWFGRPSLATRPDGTWLLIFREATGHGPSTDAAFHVVFSADEGATWSDDDTTLSGAPVEGFPHTRPEGEVSDATVTHHRGDLIVHVIEEREPFGELETPWVGTRQLRSTDGGRTWTDEGIIDPDGIAPESLLLGQDHAVHPNGDRYESVFVTRNGARSPPFKTGLVRTDDCGRSWEYVGDVTGFEDDTNETGLAFVGGELVAVIRDSNAERTYGRRSPDAGETWGPLTSVTDSLGVFQRPRVYTPADIGGDTHHGEWLYVVGRHVLPECTRTAIAASPDAGETWYGPFGLGEHDDCGYCDLRTREDGDHVLVTYGGPSTEEADLLAYVIGEA